MGNFKKHASTGAVVGGLSGLIIDTTNQYNRIKCGQQEKFEWLELIVNIMGGTALGTMTGILPDFLEPAKHPNHRKFFHSLTAASAIGIGLYKASISNLPTEIKTTINVAGLGYISHLIVDARTPKCLPII
ncbi:MAG: hypothetical protein AB7V36_07185 [Bacteroidales bacterium]